MNRVFFIALAVLALTAWMGLVAAGNTPVDSTDEARLPIAAETANER